MARWLKNAVYVLTCALAMPAWGEADPVKPVDQERPESTLRPVLSTGAAWAEAPQEIGGPKETQPAPTKVGDLVATPKQATPAPAEPPLPTPIKKPVLSARLAAAVALDERLRKEEKDPRKVRHEQIAATYRKVVEAEPDSAEARHRYGLALARAGQHADGAAEIEKALVLDPGQARYLSDLATVYMYANQLTKALEAAARAIVLEPASAQYRNAQGNILLTAGEFHQAAECYGEAIAREPNNPRFLHNLARAYLSGDEAKGAIKVLEEVTKLTPNVPEPYNDRGVAHQMLGEFAKAIRDFKEAVRIHPKYADAHHNLALLFSNEKHIEFCNRFDAMDHAKAAVKLTDGKNATYLMGLAGAFRANFMFEKAVEVAKAACALSPTPTHLQQLERLEKLERQGYLDDVKIPGKQE